MKSRCFKLYRAYIHLDHFVKCGQFFVELNFKRLYRSSGKEKGSRCLVFASSTKREIRHFHVVVVRWRQRSVQKSVMHVQSCCFADLNLLLFCRSRWRRRCRRCCLSFVLTNNQDFYPIKKEPRFHWRNFQDAAWHIASFSSYFIVRVMKVSVNCHIISESYIVYFFVLGVKVYF